MSWPKVKLGDCCTVDWGNTKLTKKSYVEKGKYLAVSAAGCDGRIGHAEHKKYKPVLSAIGANCGKMFYPEEDFTAIKNTITFTPITEVIVSKFLFYLLTFIELPQRGAGQPFISKGDIQKFKVPIPPIEEQRRIAAILDKAVEVERASEKIQVMRDEMIQSTFLDMFGDYLNGELQPLKNLVNFSQGQQFGVELQLLELKEGYSRFLRIVDFTQGDDIRYVPNVDDKYYVHTDDIVIVRYGASAGFVGTNKEGVLANNLFKVNYNREKFNQAFLFHIFQHGRFKKFVEREAFGAAMPALSFKVMERFEIPVPPIDLQNQFADIVQQITDLDLSASEAHATTLKASLTQELLA